MPEIHATRPPEVLTDAQRAIVALLEALRWASVLRLTVLPVVEGHGIRCETTTVRHVWVRDTRYGEVSPFGSAVLVDQPRTSDTQFAISMALGVPSWEVLGALGLGLEGHEQPVQWDSRDDVSDLRKAHEAGANMRIHLLAQRRSIADYVATLPAAGV